VELCELQKQQAAETTALETGEEIDNEEVLSEEEWKKKVQAEKEQRLAEMKRKSEIAKVAMEEELKQVLTCSKCSRQRASQSCGIRVIEYVLGYGELLSVLWYDVLYAQETVSA